MTEYAWPEALRPTRLTFYLQHNTTRFVSPVTRATQVLRREGARWVAQATFDPLDRVRAGVLEGLLAAEYDMELTGFDELEIATLPTSDGIEFPEYDESLADEVEMITCPGCGHTWPG